MFSLGLPTWDGCNQIAYRALDIPAGVCSATACRLARWHAHSLWMHMFQSNCAISCVVMADGAGLLHMLLSCPFVFVIAMTLYERHTRMFRTHGLQSNGSLHWNHPPSIEFPLLLPVFGRDDGASEPESQTGLTT